MPRGGGGSHNYNKGEGPDVGHQCLRIRRERRPDVGCRCIHIKGEGSIRHVQRQINFLTVLHLIENGGCRLIYQNDAHTIQYKSLIAIIALFSGISFYFHLDFANRTSIEHARKRIRHESRTVSEFGYFY